MISEIKISNFRCFQEFTLDSAARITLISGRNNVGKTALLETVFLLFATLNPDAFVKINLIRGNLLTIFKPDVTWEHLFYNKDIEKPVEISLNYNNQLYSLKLIRNSQILVNQIPSIPANIQLPLLPNSYALEIEYNYNNKINRGFCFPVQNGLTINWNNPPDQTDLPIVKYIGISPDNEQNLAIQFGQVVKNGEKESLLDALKILEPDLLDISTVAEDTPRLYAKKKDHPMLPLSSMGNGICRLTQILCSVFEHKKSIILVDEIDSGFHYSFFPKLWNILSNILKNINLQLFATTHSYECLRGASECFNRHNDSFLYIRLGTDAYGKISPHIYSPDLMAYSINSEMEIR